MWADWWYSETRTIRERNTIWLLISEQAEVQATKKNPTVLMYTIYKMYFVIVTMYQTQNPRKGLENYCVDLIIFTLPLPWM